MNRRWKIVLLVVLLIICGVLIFKIGAYKISGNVAYIEEAPEGLYKDNEGAMSVLLFILVSFFLLGIFLLLQLVKKEIVEKEEQKGLGGLSDSSPEVPLD